MITLFVGDVDRSTAVAAAAFDRKAKLVTQKNFKKISHGTYYTSLGDIIDSDKFTTLLKKADTIIYSPPPIWSDTDSTGYSRMKEFTEYELTNLKCFEYKDVQNIDNIELPHLKIMMELENVRQTKNSQLWVVGCSISNGEYVHPNERYGQLIADQLNLPVSFLTKNGTSISWAADQILRSDICSGDTVVWGLTTIHRLTYFKDDCIHHLNTLSYKKFPHYISILPIDRLFERDLIYRAITDIYKVINFCNKLNVKLIVAGILTDLNHYTLTFDNYVQLCYHSDKPFIEQFKDLGTDNLHPGPLTHKWYADQILGKLK